MKAFALVQIAIGLLALALCAMALGLDLAQHNTKEAKLMGWLIFSNLCVVGWGIRGFRDAD